MIQIEDRFARGQDLRESIQWSCRDVVVREGDREVFRQDGVEAPAGWSDRAVEQPARLYFRTFDGRKEDSVCAMLDRVLGTIVHAALRPDVGTSLVSAEGASTLERELAALVLSQSFAWNTPVWVNAGAPLPPGEKPQCSACFIQSVDDNMESITALQRSETQLFRRGSGTGTNFSTLRPERFPISRGGWSSGPVNFMVGYDAWAAVTKSGGSSRRAAKMCILNVSHPDILAFIETKVTAQRMIRTLVENGWSGDFNDPATTWARYQNANHSVRVPDAFMKAVVADELWPLVWDGRVIKMLPARKVWRAICEAAHECGDPGLQFDDTINAMHTSPAGGRINASNPCSEYMFLDDSACNLASLNLRKFQDAAGGLDVEAFRCAARVAIVSMEAIVSAAGYPTERIAKNSHDYRPLGLGYANLGAFLMASGLAYDSDEGRGVAAAITALLAGVAYRTSAEMARDCGGPFPGYEPNRDTMLRVVARHRAALIDLIEGQREYERLPLGWAGAALAAEEDWDEALRVGAEHGFRNSQLTVLAPTGTIGIMMDCDTTGVEPDTGLVRRKRLAGKGTVRFVNASVGDAMRRLGYDEAQVSRTVDALEREERLVGVRDEHLPVFACAFGVPESGWPVLSGEAHVRMVAAVQPYLSGAVSKTCNLPASASVEDVERLYRLAWETGCKAVAIYRDGSKGSQPLTVGAPVVAPAAVSVAAPTAVSVAAPTAVPVAAPAAVPVAAPAGSTLAWGDRRRLPDERPSVTRKFCIEGHDFYFHIGLVEQDGSAIDMTKPVDLFSKRPLELFIGGAAKEGTLVGGLLDALGVAVSMMLQHGASFDKALEKWIGTKFDPAGWLGDPEFPQATSPLDAFAGWARARFHGTPLSIGAPAANDGSTDAPAPTHTPARRVDLSARGCPRGCGPMRQEGTCWRCEVCGDPTGGCGG